MMNTTNNNTQKSNPSPSMIEPNNNNNNNTNNTSNSNELPTPPSVPINDPSVFPQTTTTTTTTNNNNHNNNNTNNNTNNSTQSNPIPLNPSSTQQTAPLPPPTHSYTYPTNYPHHVPPSSHHSHHVTPSTHYPHYPLYTNPGYNAHHLPPPPTVYPATRYAPTHSTSYQHLHHATHSTPYHHHPSSYNPRTTGYPTQQQPQTQAQAQPILSASSSHSHTEYPAFNGIKAKNTLNVNDKNNKLQKPNVNHNKRVNNNNNNNNNNKNGNAVTAKRSSTSAKPVKRENVKQAAIHPTYRPFYELPEDHKDDDESEDEMDVDNESEENDSDYDPGINENNNKNREGGKKKRRSKKRKTKSKKSKSGRKSKSKYGKSRGKKRRDNDNRYTMYLAQQMLKITPKEAEIPTKALKWSEFRLWLKQNMTPFYHIHTNKQYQKQLFAQKVQRLLSFCTKIELELEDVEKIDGVSTYYCLWLQIPQKEKWIQLIINDGDWFTNCTSEQTMMTLTTKPGTKYYWFFRIIENQSSTNNTILLLRADKGGVCGELVWLQKGQNVSGTDALAIENAISEALDLKWTYLHDDSKINVPGNSTRSHNCLYLKTLRSIAKGKSWYAQALYAPFSCKNWPAQSNKNQTGVDPHMKFTQNAKEYKNAIQYIRSLRYKQVRILLINNTNWSLMINKGKKNKNKKEEIKTPPLQPSDIKELDDIIANMRGYDPYKHKYGQPRRLRLNDDDDSDDIVDPQYFFKFSDDEDIDIHMNSNNGTGGDNNDELSVKYVENEVVMEEPLKRKRGRPRKNKTPDKNHTAAKKIGKMETYSSLGRQTRSRSKKDPMELKKEKLKENSEKCEVGRWRRRRVKIRHSKTEKFEYIMKNEWDTSAMTLPLTQNKKNTSSKNGSPKTKEENEEKKRENEEEEEKKGVPVVIEYEKRLKTIGEVTAVLFAEANPEFWGLKERGYGLKMIRQAKENLLKFFKKVLTSIEEPTLNKHECTKEFLKFHKALHSIEKTKIFGKRGRIRKEQHPHHQQPHNQQRTQQLQQHRQKYYSSRPAPPHATYYHHQQKQQRQQPIPRALNSKDNPIRIPSSTNTSLHSSPNKNHRASISPSSRHESQEPLLEVATKKQMQIDHIQRRQQQQQQQQQQHSVYHRRQYAMQQRNNYYKTHHNGYYANGAYGHPHWAYRGYGTQQQLLPAHLSRNGTTYYGGYNQQLRHELAGDAEKLKRRQIQERQQLSNHKSFLQKDLEEHLAPTPSKTNSPLKTNSPSKTKLPSKNDNDNKDNKNVIRQENKGLFESLIGKPAQKKTVQPPLRVHRNLVDTIVTKSNSHSNSPPKSNVNHNNNNNNNNNNDTDSTLSTLTIKSQNNDSDSTSNTKSSHNVNISMPDNVSLNTNGTTDSVNCSTLNAEKDKNVKLSRYSKKDIIVLDSDVTEHENDDESNTSSSDHDDESSYDHDDDDDDDDDVDIQQTKKIMTRSRSKQLEKKRSLHDSTLPANKKRKINNNPFKTNVMNVDELIEEIKKYDSTFCLRNKKNKWCRYCGSKMSSKWIKQNKLILCDIHNKLYKENNTFKTKIDRYRKVPKKPIDTTKNTEQQYLESKLKLVISKHKRLRNPK